MQAQPPAIVLLGGSGFVGDAVLRALYERPAPVHVLVHRQPLRHAPPGLQMHHGAIDALPPGLLPTQPHVVIHCASKQIDSDGSGYGINLRGVEALGAALTAQTRAVLFLSSFSVYGEGTQRDIDEAATLRPGTALARSRADCERRLATLCAARGCALYVLRTRFVLGEGDRYVLPGIVAALRRGLMPGSGAQRYSCIDVADLAQLLLQLAARAQPADGLQVCNAAYARPIAMREIAELWASSEARPIPARHLPLSETALRLLARVPVGSIQRTATKLQLVGLDHYGRVDRLAALLPQAAALLQRDPREVVRAALRHVSAAAA